MKIKLMKKLPKISAYLVCSTFLLFLVSNCGPRGAIIKVKNNSGTDLTNLVISGNGFSNTIPKLKSNESTSIQVFPKGESSLTVQFLSNGKEFNLPQDTYFEGTGQYSVFVEIKDDLTVNIEVTI